MRYPASEKHEIIHLVEQSHLPAKRTLDKLGIPRTTFYRWYDRYLTFALTVWKTAAAHQERCGTAFPMKFASKSSILLWTSPSCHRGNCSDVH